MSKPWQSSSAARRTAQTAEDLRRFQLHQVEAGVSVPMLNGAVSALRFFFTTTLERGRIWRAG